MTPTTLFVYGTLMRGEANHGLLASARALGPATTAARYELIDCGWHPALLHGGAVTVRGELYEVESGLLAELDRFEDHPRWFRREPVEVQGGPAAEAYFLPRDGNEGAQRIAGGDWRARSGR